MKNNKLILSFYVLTTSLSVAALGMSIAWYATSNRLRIESFTITIDASRQLAISTDVDHGYVKNLEQDRLNDPGLFTPVTSAYSSNWLPIQLDMPIFYDDTNYSETESSSITLQATGGYFSQKLYLKADDDVYVTINPEETYIKANTEYNAIYAQQLYSEYMYEVDRVNHDSDPDNDIPPEEQLSLEDFKERLANLVNAMRFSILINDENYYQYYIIDPNKTEETYYSGLLDNNVDRYYDYYRKQSDGLEYEKLYGEFVGDVDNIIYKDPLDDDSEYYDPTEEPNAFNAMHKKGVKRIDLQSTLDSGLIELKREESYSLEGFDTPNKPFHFPVYQDRPQEIVLSIYIEGWDLDSINYTMGATFNSSIAFNIEREI